VEALGAGSADHEVAACSRQTGRSILTNDDGFFSQIDGCWTGPSPSREDLLKLCGCECLEILDADVPEFDAVTEAVIR
jgi:hypothetical protein